MPARKASSPRSRARSPLSPDRIVAAALALANERGDFSMRALGQRLGVDPMAIYRHFRDKNAVLDAMVDAALADFAPPSPDAGTPIERLRLMAIDFRRALATHPGVALRVSTSRPVLGPHSLELTETCLALLTELGLDPAEATRAYSALVRYITGVAGAEDPVRAAGLSETDWQEEMRGAYVGLPSDRYPHLSRMGHEMAKASFDDQFEFGVDLLLDALAHRAQA